MSNPKAHGIECEGDSQKQEIGLKRGKEEEGIEQPQQQVIQLKKGQEIELKGVRD